MKILFVCKANCFRSFSAEYLTKAYLAQQGIDTLHVSSAGTKPGIHPYPTTVQVVKELGGNPQHHTPRLVTPEIIAEHDIVICFSKQHQEAMKPAKSFLFNELALGKKEDLMDDVEHEKKFGPLSDLDAFVRETVMKIHDGIPTVVGKVRSGYQT